MAEGRRVVPKENIPESQKASIRQRLKMMLADGTVTEEDVEFHERNLLAQKRKRDAKKKARKRARASRKKNR